MRGERQRQQTRRIGVRDVTNENLHNENDIHSCDNGFFSPAARFVAGFVASRNHSQGLDQTVGALH